MAPPVVAVTNLRTAPEAPCCPQTPSAFSQCLLHGGQSQLDVSACDAVPVLRHHPKALLPLVQLALGVL